jgi:cytochrome c oxidase assembly factor CtaG
MLLAVWWSLIHYVYQPNHFKPRLDLMIIFKSNFVIHVFCIYICTCSSNFKFANTTFTLYHTNSEWLHYRGHACTYCTSKGYGTRVR